MVHEMLEPSPGFGEYDSCESDPGGGAMDVLTTVKGQTGLPRYFAAAFEAGARMGEGRVDFILPDGRRFRVEGKAPGIAAAPT